MKLNNLIWLGWVASLMAQSTLIRSWGASNEYPQPMLLWWNEKNYPRIITKLILRLNNSPGPVKILIRLHECAGWSASWLDAHVARYIFWHCCSNVCCTIFDLTASLCAKFFSKITTKLCSKISSLYRYTLLKKDQHRTSQGVFNDAYTIFFWNYLIQAYTGAHLNCLDL